MIGDDWPLPGSCDFQTMFSAVHCTGRPVSIEWPFSCGPRQRGQLTSPAIATDANNTAAITANVFEETEHNIRPVLNQAGSSGWQYERDAPAGPATRVNIATGVGRDN
jgi:hypothetical protein